MNGWDPTQLSYEKTAAEYAKNVAELHPREMAEKFMALLPPAGHILDVGCGSGRDAKVFSEKGYQVVGVDFCSSLLEIARKTAPEVLFYQMDIRVLEFPLQSFNGMWASASLLHIPKRDIPSVLQRLRPFLKPNGIFYLSVKQGGGEAVLEDERYEGATKCWSFFQPDEVRDYLSDAGFHVFDFIVTPTRHPYDTHPAIRVFASLA